jgi:hypothetical protein
MSESLERALAGFDQGFETALVEQITATIAAASMMSYGDGHQVLVLRLGEIAGALTTVLAGTLTLSPPAVRTPRAIKQTDDGFRRKLAANVRAAEGSPDFYEFKRQTFGEDDRDSGGNA